MHAMLVAIANRLDVDQGDADYDAWDALQEVIEDVDEAADRLWDFLGQRGEDSPCLPTLDDVFGGPTGVRDAVKRIRREFDAYDLAAEAPDEAP